MSLIQKTNGTKQTLFIFGVHDERDISLTSLFSEILDTQNWLHKDCFHWLERDGMLCIANVQKRAKLTFEVNSPASFNCVVSSMMHRSLPF